MKIDGQKTEKDRVSIVAEVPIKKQLEHLGTLHPKNGHICFEMNLLTHEIKVAKYEQQTVDYIAASKGQIVKSNKIIVNDNCIYETALNKENVAKKFLKRLFEIFKQEQTKKATT
jgi:glutamate formiminotransferase